MCTFVVVVVVDVVPHVCTFVVVEKVDRLPDYLIVFLSIFRISELMVFESNVDAMVTLTWHVSKYSVHELYQRCTFKLSHSAKDGIRW